MYFKGALCNIFTGCKQTKKTVLDARCKSHVSSCKLLFLVSKALFFLCLQPVKMLRNEPLTVMLNKRDLVWSLLMPQGDVMAAGIFLLYISCFDKLINVVSSPWCYLPVYTDSHEGTETWRVSSWSTGESCKLWLALTEVNKTFKPQTFQLFQSH